MNKREIGSIKEREAATFLKEKGYHILECNYNSRTGEIDIVGKEGGYFVFIEVKYRSNVRNGYPSEAIDFRKIKHITRTARLYLMHHGLSEFTPCRFDVIEILGNEMKLIQNAFDAID